MDDTSNHELTPPAILREKSVRVIHGRSLDEWRELARRDDCFDQMVPSQLRALIAAIPNAS